MHPVAKALLLNTGLALFVPIVAWCFFPAISMRSLTRSFTVSFVYANCVGTLFHLSMAKLWIRSMAWTPLLMWAFRLAMVVCVATVGSFAGAAILQLLWNPSSYWALFWDG